VDATPPVVGRHRRARRRHAQWMRFVAQRLRIGERVEQAARIRETGTRRIGFGEVDKRLAACPDLIEHARQAVRLSVRRQAIREHRLAG
jgi:hypothetical protein